MSIAKRLVQPDMRPGHPYIYGGSLWLWLKGLKSESTQTRPHRAFDDQLRDSRFGSIWYVHYDG